MLSTQSIPDNLDNTNRHWNSLRRDLNHLIEVTITVIKGEKSGL